MKYSREEVEEKCKSAFEEAAAGIDFPEKMFNFFSKVYFS